MDPIVTGGRLGVVLLAIAVSSVLAAALVRHRRRPAARPLLGVAVALTVGSLLHLLVVGPILPGVLHGSIGWQPGGLWWVIQGATVTVIAGGAWTLFAFEYSGRGGTLYAAIVAGVGLLVGSALALAGWAATAGASPAVLDWLTVVFLLAAIATAVGVSLLCWASLRQNAFPVLEPLLLAGGALVCLSGIHLAQVFDRPWLYPATIALASGSMLVPIVRYPTFDTLPAARVAGRDRVVEELSAGVIVLDRDGRIRDLNGRAATLFDVDAAAVLDGRLADLVGPAPDPEDVVRSREPVRLTTDRRTTVELVGEPITGHGDRPLGSLLLCTDVTERRIRAEQLTLLRRFVVDVVGTRMDDVATLATDPPADGELTPDARADRIWETATDLATLVASAREIERTIARPGAGDDRASSADGRAGGANDYPSTADDRRPTIEAIGGDVFEGTDVDASVQIGETPFRTSTSRSLFETMLRGLLEDVRRHAGDEVELVATMEGGPTIVVRDDRPAAAGDISAGTGASDELPLTRLAVEQVGGHLSIAQQDGHGRRVAIELPGPGVGTEDGGGDRAVAGDGPAPSGGSRP